MITDYWDNSQPNCWACQSCFRLMPHLACRVQIQSKQYWLEGLLSFSKESVMWLWLILSISCPQYIAGLAARTLCFLWIEDFQFYPYHILLLTSLARGQWSNHDEYGWITHMNPRPDSRLAPRQWETALLCNDVSHWLGAKLRISPESIYDCDISETKNATKCVHVLWGILQINVLDIYFSW